MERIKFCNKKEKRVINMADDPRVAALIAEQNEAVRQSSYKKSRSSQGPVDPDDLPDDYNMSRISVLIPNHLSVGRRPVTAREKRYLKEKAGDPHVIELALPPIKERKSWSLKEAALWYGSYARTLLKEHGARPHLYLCYDTGSDEEIIVGLVLWNLLVPQQAPKTKEEVSSWRERNAYLWIFYNDEEMAMDIVTACADDIASKNGLKDAAKRNSQLCMSSWLGRSKSK
jgi:hypothetical protein